MHLDEGSRLRLGGMDVGCRTFNGRKKVRANVLVLKWPLACKLSFR